MCTIAGPHLAFPAVRYSRIAGEVNAPVKVIGLVPSVFFCGINGLALHRDLYDPAHFVKPNAYDIVCDALRQGEIKGVNAIIFVTPM